MLGNARIAIYSYQRINLKKMKHLSILSLYETVFWSDKIYLVNIENYSEEKNHQPKDAKEVTELEERRYRSLIG